MTDKTPQVVTRFPPSPTGTLHTGSLRTALFNYLYAKHMGGRCVFRFEDTDKARSKKEYEDNMIEAFEWLGLQFDGEIVRQSERTDIYKTYLEKMVAEGKAYVSKEDTSTPTEDGTERRSEVIRFKNPNRVITFHDEIRGDITFDTTELGDFVIAKSFSEPLYHLGVVVDDFEMGVTHVIRGEDHISNTPRQILIGEAIGAPRPRYAHLPLILATDRTKLSKRKGSRAVTEYRDLGFLKEALINYTAFLGWNPGTEQEIFTLDELIRDFSLERVQKAGAIYNEEKLRWINKEHIKRMPPSELEKRIVDTFARVKGSSWNMSSDLTHRLVPVILDRIETFSDLETHITAGDFDYFFEAPTYDTAAMIWKESNAEQTLTHLTHVVNVINTLPEHPAAEDVKGLLWDYATEQGRANVLWPLRYSLTGKQKSPDPFTVISIIGIPETLSRIDIARKKLSSHTS